MPTGSNAANLSATGSRGLKVKSSSSGGHYAPITVGTSSNSNRGTRSNNLRRYNGPDEDMTEDGT